MRHKRLHLHQRLQTLLNPQSQQPQQPSFNPQYQVLMLDDEIEIYQSWLTPEDFDAWLKQRTPENTQNLGTLGEQSEEDTIILSPEEAKQLLQQTQERFRKSQ